MASCHNVKEKEGKYAVIQRIDPYSSNWKRKNDALDRYFCNIVAMPPLCEIELSCMNNCGSIP